MTGKEVEACPSNSLPTLESVSGDGGKGEEVPLLNGEVCISSNQVTERIEDHRFPASSESGLRCRAGGQSTGSTVSLPTLPTTRDILDIDIRGSMLSLKQTIQSKIANGGKICKDCLNKSIESHLCSLGLGKANLTEGLVKRPVCDVDVDVNEVGEKEVQEADAKSTTSDKSEHRRTLSEIDWHTLTQFAQGDEIDPESKTARELVHTLAGAGSATEISLACQLMRGVDFGEVVEEAERCVQCMINNTWRVVSHWELPHWLRDNDFLWHMHRPQLPSFKDCFQSMFRVHTETGNIWTHFIGMLMVLMAMIYIFVGANLSPKYALTYPRGWTEYGAFTSFFVGAFMCLMFSWLFHTCYCHSEKTNKLFSKLDYLGIAFMIVGSFIPCMYYGFYCNYTEKLTYIILISIMGATCIVVSMWDKFATPKYRPLRAGVFLFLGCSAFIPCIHMIILHGFAEGVAQASLGWCLLMGLMYIGGALLYASRIPERFLPGKCNLYIQSHQIWHVIVVAAAFIHLHGICQSALYRIEKGRECPATGILPLTISNATKNFMEAM